MAENQAPPRAEAMDNIDHNPRLHSSTTRTLVWLIVVVVAIEAAGHLF